MNGSKMMWNTTFLQFLVFWINSHRILVSLSQWFHTKWLVCNMKLVINSLCDIFINCRFLDVFLRCTSSECYFQQQAATSQTTCQKIELSWSKIPVQLILRFGEITWPPRLYDLAPLDFFGVVFLFELSWKVKDNV